MSACLHDRRQGQEGGRERKRTTHHLVPCNTGQPVCRLNLSCRMLPSLVSQNRTALPAGPGGVIGTVEGRTRPTPTCPQQPTEDVATQHK